MLLDTVRNIFALVLAVFASLIVRLTISDSYLVALMVFAFMTLLIMNNDTESSIFILIKFAVQLVYIMLFCVLLYQACNSLVDMKYFLVCDIAVGVVSFLLFAVITISRPDEERLSNLRRSILQSLWCVCFLFAALLLFAILHKWIGVPYIIAVVLIEIPYVIFAFIGVCGCH